VSETLVIAGDCTARFEGSRERTQRGRALVLVKPDNTVLVHDSDGYQPVAWLTRPPTLAVEHDPVAVRARDGDQRLAVEVHDGTLSRSPTSEAGVPVGACPDCGGALARTCGAVTCTDCTSRYAIPTDATVLEETCGDCGLPRMRVARGATFEVCVDRRCESLDAAVADRFDGIWACPDCEAPLHLKRRGGLLACCSAYPECDTAFALPDGVVAGACDCGLPRFETSRGGRCLDAKCTG
jgi:DNA topoisomerase-1